MKIYSQTIDLSTVIPQTFFVSPNSQFKMGVKLVQNNEFVVKSGNVTLTPDETTLDGFTTYTLVSSKPGRKTYVVECDNGQKIEITQVTTNSTVFEVGGEGGSAPIGDVVTKVNGEYPVEGNVDVDKLKIEGGFVTGDVLMKSISDVEDELDGKANAEDIPTKVSELENDSGYVTTDDIPSKTSDLENDSGFITQDDVPSVPTKTSELENDSGYVTYDDIPTSTSQLENDSGFITSDDVDTKIENIPTTTMSGEYEDGSEFSFNVLIKQ